MRIVWRRRGGDGVFKYIVRAMEGASKQVLEKARLSVEDVDVLIPHQANVRIVDAVYKRLGVDESKVVVNLDRLGNTSSATIPIAFDESVRNGRIKEGDVVLMVAFGGGLTWGSVLLRYGWDPGESGRTEPFFFDNEFPDYWYGGNLIR